MYRTCRAQALGHGSHYPGLTHPVGDSCIWLSSLEKTLLDLKGEQTSIAVSSFWWKQWGKGWEKVNFVPSYTGLPSIILKEKSQVISWLKVSNDFQLHLKNLNKSKFTLAKSTLHDSYCLSNLMTQCLLVHWSPFPCRLAPKLLGSQHNITSSKTVSLTLFHSHSNVLVLSFMTLWNTVLCWFLFSPKCKLCSQPEIVLYSLKKNHYILFTLCVNACICTWHRTHV